MSTQNPIEVVAQVTIQYHTESQLEALKARIPPGVTPLIDLLLKRVSFTILQQIEGL